MVEKYAAFYAFVADRSAPQCRSLMTLKFYSREDKGVIITFSCQFGTKPESPRKRDPQLNNYVCQIVLWLPREGFSSLLTDGRQLSPLEAEPLLGRWSWVM